MSPVLRAAILSLGLLPLTACDKHPESTPSTAAQAASSESLSVDSAAASASLSQTCSGTPPRGELKAERVIQANSTRSEPGLYEGAVWVKDALYFSDFTFGPGFPSRIQRLDAAGMTTAIDDSGSNGLAVTLDGKLLAATHKYKGLSIYDPATGQRSAGVSEYQGNPFNSPNDLAITKAGVIYFTDPAFQKDAAPGGQEKTAVYRVDPSGQVTLVDDTIANPNGISLSPAEDFLYVNGGGEQGIVRSYPLVNGEPQAGKDLVNGLVIPDGMAVDCQGNIYVTEHTAQRVRVFSPAGEPLATILTDANVTNAAFGGADGKTLFLTGAGAVWKVELDITGSPY